jgi:Protein of unknown function (DUF4012)
MNQEVNEAPPSSFTPTAPRGRRKRRRRRLLPRWSLSHSDPVRAHSRRKRLRKIKKKALVWGPIILLVLLLDGLYCAWSLYSSLNGSRTHLEAGSAAAREGNFALARQEFDDALGEADSASLTSRHPSALLGGFVPGIGNDVRAVRSLARVARLTSLSGVAAADAADAMGAGNGSLAGSVFSNGQINFDAVREGHPYIKEIDGLVAEAVDEIQGVAPPSLETVKAALAEARERLPGASEAAHKTNILFDALPGLFAQEGQRKYLLLFQAPSDQRGGSGGIIGLYGILEATNGRMELAHIGSPYEEKLSPTPLERSEVPDWYAKSYGWAAGLRDWQSVTLSPHFPVVSQVLLTMYEKKTGERLDGVLALDPVAFAELTKATGPLQGEGIETEVNSDNAVDVLARDVYLTYGNDQLSQNDYLETVMMSFWEKFSSGNVDAVALGEALGEAARTHHLKWWVADPNGEEALNQIGTTANYTTADPNVQMVFNENVAGNKIDYFLHRTVNTDIELKENGDAEITTTAVLENRSPKGPPSLLIGPGFKTDPPGLNAMYINFLLPDNAEIDRFEIKEEKKSFFRLREEDHPIASEIVLVHAGQTETASVAYTVENAVEFTEEGGRFEFTMWPHTTINPDRFNLNVSPPYGYSLTQANSSADFQLEGTLDEPQSFNLDLTAR